MQELSDNPTIGEMRLNDFFDAMVVEVAIADRPGPDGQVGAVVAAPLTATCAYFAGCSELMVGQRLCQCGAQRFATAKSTVAEIDAQRWLCHTCHYHPWYARSLYESACICHNISYQILK